MAIKLTNKTKHILEEENDDSPNEVTKAVVIAGSAAIPGGRLLTEGTLNAYEEYEDGSDTSAIALAAVGLDKVTNAATNKESSWWEKIIDTILAGVSWFFKTISFGAISPATETTSSISLGYKVVTQWMRQKHIADLFDSKEIEDIVEAIDQDKNGISDAELRNLEEILDYNGDGKVTRNDVKALSKWLILNHFDKDFNGQLSQKELKNHNDNIHEIDTNCDDKITQDEINDFMYSPNYLLIEYIKKYHDDVHSRSTYDEDDARSNLIRVLGRSSKPVVEQRWNELDRKDDNDESVDYDEHQYGLNQLDSNNNGVVDEDEIRSHAGNDANKLFDKMIARQERE